MTLTGLAAKNILRNKFRTTLTVLGVAVAILTFVLLRTVLGAWTRGAEFAAKDRVVTRHKVTFVMPLPKRYIDDVRNMPHVKGATWASWFGGKDPKHDREFFATLAVDSQTYFDVYDEIAVSPAEKDAFVHDRRAAIVGDVLAKKFGWKVGDKVTLQTGIYPDDPADPWTFTIVGVYTATSKSADRSTFLFHWDYLNEKLPARRRDTIGWITTRVDDPTRAAELSAAIDRSFDDKEIQTLSQDEATFRNGFLAAFSAILKALDIISIVILVIMMLILGNTIAMGVRERTNEYGVLRAIGFLPRHIAGFILGEAILTALVGGVLGLVLGAALIQGVLSRVIEENMGSMFPYFRISAPVAALAVALAVVLGALAAVLPAYRASRLHVVDALRRVA